MATRLTTRLVEKLPPDGKRVFDSEARGLFVVNQRRGPYYHFMYRYRADPSDPDSPLKQHTLRIGPHNGGATLYHEGEPKAVHTLDLGRARREAKYWRAQLDGQRDPATVKRELKAKVARADMERAENTFGALADTWWKFRGSKLKSRKTIKARLQRASDKWQDTPIADIEKHHVNALLDGIEAKHGPGAAEDVLRTIRPVFKYARDERGVIDHSPLEGMKPRLPYDPRKHQRELSDNEIRDLWLTCEKHGGPFARLVQGLLLTGLRRNELARAKWAELRESKSDGMELLIPPDRSKNGLPHLVPVSDALRHVLANLPREGEFVFSTTHGKKPISGFSKLKAALDKECSIDHWTLHDLRRTCTSGMSRLGIGWEIRERVLNHSPAALEKTYNLYDFRAEKRRALDAWGAKVLDIAAGQERSSNVVSMTDATA